MQSPSEPDAVAPSPRPDSHRTALLFDASVEALPLGWQSTPPLSQAHLAVEHKHSSATRAIRTRRSAMVDWTSAG